MELHVTNDKPVESIEISVEKRADGSVSIIASSSTVKATFASIKPTGIIHMVYDPILKAMGFQTDASGRIKIE